MHLPKHTTTLTKQQKQLKLNEAPLILSDCRLEEGTMPASSELAKALQSTPYVESVSTGQQPSNYHSELEAPDKSGAFASA